MYVCLYVCRRACMLLDLNTRRTQRFCRTVIIVLWNKHKTHVMFVHYTASLSYTHTFNNCRKYWFIRGWIMATLHGYKRFMWTRQITTQACCLDLHFTALNLVCLQKQYSNPVAQFRTYDAEDVLPVADLPWSCWNSEAMCPLIWGRWGTWACSLGEETDGLLFDWRAWADWIWHQGDEDIDWN